MDQPETTFLSLEWGIQSFATAAMTAVKELPPIDLAMHADTGHEAQGAYGHARRWTAWLEERGLPVVTVHTRDKRTLREDWSNSVRTRETNNHEERDRMKTTEKAAGPHAGAAFGGNAPEPARPRVPDGAGRTGEKA